MTYLDSSYIVKCYLREPGSDRVLAWLEGQTGLSSAMHGRLEVVAAFRRQAGEGRLSASDLEQAVRRFEEDERQGYWHWLPVTEALVRHSCARLLTVPPGVLLRSADALHLACAAAEGFEAVYSHDRHLLAAAPYFGLAGRDVLAAGREGHA